MAGLIALGAALVVLVTTAAVTARPPTAGTPDIDGYLTRWQSLHGDVDPRANPWLHGWLVLGYAVARPLARRGVKPDVLTTASTWLAVAAIVVTEQGGRWLLLAAWLIVLSGLGDTLDGAVAIATERTTRWGYVLDSTVDRVNDVLYLVAVGLVAGVGWIAVVAGVAFFLLEYVRARGRNAGASEVGTITVGERAMRVICCAVGLLGGGLVPGLRIAIAMSAVAVLAVLSLIGLAQVLLAVRRDLQA